MTTIKKIAGAALLLLTALCPVIFTALYHYVFAQFDGTQGMATFFACMFTMVLCLGAGSHLLGIDIAPKG